MHKWLRACRWMHKSLAGE